MKCIKPMTSRFAVTEAQQTAKYWDSCVLSMSLFRLITYICSFLLILTGK